MKNKKEEFVKALGWRKIKGVYIDHSGFSNEFEGTYWHGKDYLDFVRKCTFWENATEENNIFEDIDELITHIEEVEDIKFTED